MPEPALRLVEPLSPEILAMRDTIAGLEATVKKQAFEIGRKDREMQENAEQDDLYPVAQRLFNYHRRVTGHARAEWNAERFRMVRKRLKKKNGLEDCLRAIAGLMADEWRVGKKLTAWEDCFGSAGKFERCLAACPSDFQMPKGAE